MSKQLKYYAIVWILLVGFFNIIAFVTPDTVLGSDKFGGAFWSCYIFVMLSYVLHFIYAVAAFSEKNKSSRSITTQLTIISYAGLFLMVLIGTCCMLIPAFPNWFGIILCYGVLAFSIIFMISTKKVSEDVEKANEVLNQKTSLFRSYTNQAQQMLSEADTPEKKKALKELYELLRYSDPVSSPLLEAQEAEIGSQLEELYQGLSGDISDEDFECRLKQLKNSIEMRNRKCIEYKRTTGNNR